MWNESASCTAQLAVTRAYLYFGHWFNFNSYLFLGLHSQRTMSQHKSTMSGNQTMLSSYFSQPPGSTQSSPSRRQQTTGQRSSSPIDLTVASDEERPAKRRKVIESPLPTKSLLSQRDTDGNSHVPPQSKGPSVVDHYRFGSRVEPQSFSPAEERARLNRHERAKRILLSGQNVLDRQNSEERGEHDAEDDFDPDDEPSQPASPTKLSAQEAVSDTGDKFKETMAFFANSKTRTGRKKATPATAPARAAKKIQEIGPSGRSYTPLELQVHIVV